MKRTLGHAMIVTLGLSVSMGCDAPLTTAPPPAPDAPPATTAAPTYWQDVEPIFHTHCASCHTLGGIGPFPIDDPLAATELAEMIAIETAERRMPPWPPGGDTPPLLHPRTLTQAQIDTIAAWAAGGAPVGDPSQPQPHEEPETIDIGPVGASFDIGVDYVPDPALEDDYRCFLAEVGVSAPTMATGYRVIPTNRATVHHVIVSLYAASSREALEALDAESPERAGWPCAGGALREDVVATPIGALGAWVPGGSDVAYPEGTGTVILSGALSVIQIHYNLHGGLDPDRTRVEIALADPSEAASLIRLGGVRMRNRDLSIPAGEPASVHERSMTVAEWRMQSGQQPFPSGRGYALGAAAHMHLLGARITYTLHDDAGDTVLFDIPRWDFHWQGGYWYVTPIPIDNDDVLTIRCEYDNSEGTAAVTWGEGTQDEMCLGGFQTVDTLP